MMLLTKPKKKLRKWLSGYKMIELSSSTINKSCKIVRTYFPSTLVLAAFRDVTGDQDLTNFPNARKFEENILKTRKAGLKIPLKSVTEMSAYFYKEQEDFLLFLKFLTTQSIQHEVVTKVALDNFISKVNILLLNDSWIRIENYKVIQKWVPNQAKKDIFLNINVPEHVQDYFTEALDCQAFDLHRSSLLFCTFALEASLRSRYAELNDENIAYKIHFNKLINWGILNNFIEQNDFNRVSIEFIRKYRNDLVHCNINKPDAKLKMSRSYAKKMSSIVIHLVELFINDIFL